MKRIFAYIEEKRKNHEQHELFSEVVCNIDLTGEDRLSWASMFIPFVMGYADLNKYVFRKENGLDDPIQQDLNVHSYEEDFHWQWMLDDMDRLRINPSYSLSDSARLFWSDRMVSSRRLVLEICTLMATSSSPVRFSVVESIEAISITFFKNCQGIQLSDGSECDFFGRVHYQAEANHSINSDEFEEGAEFTVLEEDELKDCIRAVDTVFSMFAKWFDDLKSYAQEYTGSGLRAYKDMIAQSKSTPRMESPPEYARI